MSTDGKDGPSPAYVALPTLKTLLTQFKEHGVPDQVDRSVMRSFSGGTQSHLVSSLRFLGLIGANNVPTDALRSLVDAVETDKWAEEFRPVIEAAYADVLGEVKIVSATPQQVESKFRAAGMDGSTLDKAMRFYVQALKDAAIPHSPHLGKRRRSTARRTSARRPGDERVAGGGDEIAAEERRRSSTTNNQTSGMRSFPVFVKGKTDGAVTVPDDITVEECAMLDLAVQMVKAYAAQNSSED